MDIPGNWIRDAAERIKPYILRTPLTYDADLQIYLKWENRQRTGSFKARGALNKALQLTAEEKQRGLVAASAGNHGQGVALAGQLLDAPVIIFCAENAVPAKLEAMRALGAEVRLVPGGYGDAEKAGHEFALSSKSTWISPYNDAQVIAGQGTIVLEVCEQLPDELEPVWLVPTSGGGLIAGIGSGLKVCAQQDKLVAVQAAASAFMHALYFNGSQTEVDDEPTLADGLSGPVESGSITIALVKDLVDDFVLVEEKEISHAIAYAWHRYGEKIEGSAAAALAALLKGAISARPALIVISGGNIQPEVHAEICAHWLPDLNLE